MMTFIKLAKNKLRVGLFGAMNHPGDKRLTCFVPDAWSTASCDGSYPSRCAQKVVSYLVNKNVSLRSPLKVLWPLCVMVYAPGVQENILLLLRALVAFVKRDRPRLSAYFDFFI